MYKNKHVHGHNELSDWDTFERDMKVLTGMLYTIAKAPIKPFLPAFYKTATEYKKDYDHTLNPPNK